MSVDLQEAQSLYSIASKPSPTRIITGGASSMASVAPDGLVAASDLSRFATATADMTTTAASSSSSAAVESNRFLTQVGGGAGTTEKQHSPMALGLGLGLGVGIVALTMLAAVFIIKARRAEKERFERRASRMGLKAMSPTLATKETEQMSNV